MNIEPVTSYDDLCDLREGAIVTLKGRLEAVRWNPPHRGPSICIIFADWSMVSIDVCDIPAARAVRIPLQSYVTVKARVADEDGTLEAIAIWQPGCAPIALAADLSGHPAERLYP